MNVGGSAGTASSECEEGTSAMVRTVLSGLRRDDSEVDVRLPKEEEASVTSIKSGELHVLENV